MSPTPASRMPPSVISQLVHDAHQDPLLPRNNPTEAYWQLPASKIASHKSEKLSSTTTYAIIGSGVTGCSVAKNLLDNLPSDSTATVTVLEARTLTSGATGRNGGHLLSPVSEEFGLFEKYLGKEEAAKVGRFAIRTLESMHELASEDKELSDAAEARRVTSVSAYYDEEVFEAAKKSQMRYEECLPQFKGDHEVLSAEEGLKRYNMKDSVGVITSSAGAFWPYRLITGIFSQLLQKYPNRCFIEAETPVTAVKYEVSKNQAYPYTLSTPRGQIEAKYVIYCTNGWSGHLLPNLRGKLFPLRGTMSTQEAGPAFPNQGSKLSWSTLDKHTYDPTDGTFSYGLYYITQNAHTGDIFIGGEKQKSTEVLSSDDTQISQVATDKLVQILPTIFDQGWPAGQKPVVKKLWSGIMGFTPDSLPLVGQIPKSISGRRGDGEFIAAGFNGYGMPLCWGCGEAVAKKILGRDEEVREWLPGCFEMSSKRLNSPYMTTEAGIWNILGQEPGWMETAKLMSMSALSRMYGLLFGW